MTQTVDFLVRLKQIDAAGHTARNVLILWAIAREPGLMGLELAKKLGYKSRSNVQNGIRHLIDAGLIEDRRERKSPLTPNDLHITPAGIKFLSDVVPS